MPLGKSLLSLVAIAVVACGGRPSEVVPSPLRELEAEASRPFSLMNGEPIEILSRSTFLEGRAQPASAWKLDLQPNGAAELQYTQPLSAEQWVMVTAHFRARVAGGVELTWTGHGACSETRLAPQSTTTPAEGGRATFQFFPGAEPCWKGSIEGLQLRLAGESAKRLTELIVSRPASLPEFWRSFGTSPWRIRLGNELRNGYFAPSDSLRAWTLPAGPAAALRVAFGASQPFRGGATFRVLQRQAGGTTALMEALVGEGGLAIDRWHDRWLDLPASLSPREILFEFDSPPGALAIGFWEGAELRPLQGRAPRRNVVLISIDTLRADRLSLYGNPRPTSPAIDAWARSQGVVFRRAIAQAPWTLPSHTTMLTGLDPLTHGVNADLPAPPELVTLAERLRAAGYRTQAITGGAWMGPAHGLNQGFDSFYFSPAQEDRAIELHRGVGRAVEFLRSRDREQPYFLFFHTYAVHGPHRAHPGYFERWSRFDPKLRALDSPDQVDPTSGLHRTKTMQLLAGEGRGREPLPADLAALPFDLYDSSVGAMDHELSALLSALSDERDAPTVILTSDHGESLGEHGRGGHNNLFDTTLHVPLILRAPGFGPAEIEAQVRLVDVTPTLLEAAALPSESSDGQSLFSLLSGRTEAARVAWSYSGTGNQTFALQRPNGLKAITTLNPWVAEPRSMLIYDLRRDAGESESLALQQPSLAASLREEMERRSRQMGRGIFLTATASPAAGSAPWELVLQASGVRQGGWRPLRDSKATLVPLANGTSYLLSVPPGATAEFWLEAARQIEIDSRPDRARVAARVAPELGAAAVQYCLGPTGWEGLGRDGACADTLTLYRRLGAAAPATQLDPQLEEQLRALGYLN